MITIPFIYFAGVSIGILTLASLYYLFLYKHKGKHL